MKPDGTVPLELRPVTLSEAQAFIGTHHRHNLAPKKYRFAVSVRRPETNEIVGVAAAAQPVARGLDDGETIEVIRSCTNGLPNVNSMLYGALTRAAKALGFRRMYTYTLESESGASLKASGWSLDQAGLKARGRGADTKDERYHRYDFDLFGSRIPPQEPRIRWRKDL